MKIKWKFTTSIQEGTYWDWSVSWNPFLFKNFIEAKVSNTNNQKLRPTLWQQCLFEKFPFYFLFCIIFPRFELCTKNCTALFQSYSIIFFMYIIRNENLTNDSPVVRLLAHKRLFAQLMVSFFLSMWWKPQSWM